MLIHRLVGFAIVTLCAAALRVGVVPTVDRLIEPQALQPAFDSETIARAIATRPTCPRSETSFQGMHVPSYRG